MCGVYRVIYKRDKDNILTGSAVYRVVGCIAANPNHESVKRYAEGQWGILTCKPRRVGTIINPRVAIYN